MKWTVPKAIARQALLWASVATLAVPTQMHAQFMLSTNDGQITITRYTGLGGTVNIPSTTNGLPVTSIGSKAFSYCTNLTSVTIPGSVTSIERGAFGICSNLTNVTISTDVTSIGEFAFYSCSSLTSVMIPNSVTSIGSYAFSECVNLTAITVDAGNPLYSSLDGVLLDKAQTMLLQYPGGKPGDYTIPNNVTKITSRAFLECQTLTNVTIPNSITNIGDATFSGCTRLANVTIPGSVTNIGGWAFRDCTNLTRVYFKGNVPRLEGGAFSGADNATIYHLPNTTGWGSTFGGRPTAIWKPQTNAQGNAQSK